MAIKQLVNQLICKYGTNNPFTIASEKYPCSVRTAWRNDGLL